MGAPVLFHDFCEAEVGQFDVTGCVKQDVLRLKVPAAHAQLSSLSFYGRAYACTRIALLPSGAAVQVQRCRVVESGRRQSAAR